MNLYEQFERHYKITGKNSTVKQDNRLIKNYFLEFLTNKTTLKSLKNITQNELNGFYNYLLDLVRKSKISEHYGKETLYAVNKLIKQINRKYKKDLKKYDVTKYKHTAKGFKNIKVSPDEFNNIKELRNKFDGKVPTLEKIKDYLISRQIP